jgi:hypothetical protein
MQKDRLGPFDTLEEVFRLACRGPSPLALDGTAVAGLPERAVPLDELRAILLHPSTAHPTRDATLSLLLARARREGGTATVALAGVLLFGLRRAVAVFCELCPERVADIEAETLVGLIEGIAKTDPSRRRLAARLTWLARNRAKQLVEAETTEAFSRGERLGSGPHPVAVPETDPGQLAHIERRPFSAAPPRPFGHPDFVLEKAVDEEVICADDAALVGDTRLGQLSLPAAARALGIDHWAARKRRQRAEEALRRWIESPEYEPGFVQNRPVSPYFHGGGRPRHGESHDRRPEVCPTTETQGGEKCPSRPA